MSSILSFPHLDLINADINRALKEDIGSGDATADLLPEKSIATASLLCREDAVICGVQWFETCFKKLDPNVEIVWNNIRDGSHVRAGSIICHIKGNARAMVTAERTALNFLQLLSGTATTTSEYVKAAEGTRLKILDTRKTLPGLRLAQKYAVLCGGGHNHRIGLYDMILIKENHIISAGGIKSSVETARKTHPDLKIEVEVENLDQLNEALGLEVDRIMLDNFSMDLIKEAVKIAEGKVPLEVSGNVDLEKIKELAKTGVDYVSIGGLTKHIRAIDFSLRLDIE